MNKIIIVGGGGHAKVIISILKKLKYSIYGYVDKFDKGNILGVGYIGNDNVLEDLVKIEKIKHAVLGIGDVGDNIIRHNLSKKLSDLGYSFPPIVSPNAVINEEISIGKGTVVMDGVIVNSGTKIGEFAIINTNSSIDHDCKIGNFVHIAPGVVLSGNVIVGDNTLIGTGSSIIQNIKIAGNTIIGAGSTVVSDCLKEGVYYGTPSKFIKEKL